MNSNKYNILMINLKEDVRTLLCIIQTTKMLNEILVGLEFNIYGLIEMIVDIEKIENNDFFCI